MKQPEINGLTKKQILEKFKHLETKNDLFNKYKPKKKNEQNNDVK